MSAYKFDLYKQTDAGTVAAGSIELNTETDSPATVQAELNKVLKLKEDKQTLSLIHI